MYTENVELWHPFLAKGDTNETFEKWYWGLFVMEMSILGSFKTVNTVPVRPTINVKKLTLFCQGARSQALHLCFWRCSSESEGVSASWDLGKRQRKDAVHGFQSISVKHQIVPPKKAAVDWFVAVTLQLRNRSIEDLTVDISLEKEEEEWGSSQFIEMTLEIIWN
jgi:hypothetical protein